MITVIAKSINHENTYLELVIRKIIDEEQIEIGNDLILYIRANINGFNTVDNSFILQMHTSMYHLENFLRDLEQLNRVHKESAVLIANDENTVVSIRPYNIRGYVEVNVNTRYYTEGLSMEPKIENHFNGGFVAQPAFISTWVTTIQEFVT